MSTLLIALLVVAPAAGQSLKQLQTAAVAMIAQAHLTRAMLFAVKKWGREEKGVDLFYDHFSILCFA